MLILSTFIIANYAKQAKKLYNTSYTKFFRTSVFSAELLKHRESVVLLRKKYYFCSSKKYNLINLTDLIDEKNEVSTFQCCNRTVC